MKPIFALIDCNNFFVSCERLFRPDLESRPVVVLSSNDGCAVSRSNEAKDLGIPMGAPAFKYRDLFRRHGVVQFSANFELYGDISERIIRLLTSITPRTEVYSVDEAFLDISKLEISDYTAWARSLRQKILREVGVPVSIGLAPSKTLAKLANFQAKQAREELGGVLNLIDIESEELDRHLLKTPVGDVWGIGWRLGPKMKGQGVYTALGLKRMQPRYAQQLMGINGRQLIAELNGTSCHPMEAMGRIRQTVMKGRMFGKDTSDFSVIEAAIASLTARAAYAIRREGLLATRASISLSTDRHKPGYEKQYESIKLQMPTADTGHITTKLVEAAYRMFSASKAYHRANILLYDLVGQDYIQPDIFGEVNVGQAEASQARLRAVDTLNKQYGKRTVHYAAEDLSNAWEPKHALRSPRYTTNWQELPIARILEE